MVEKKVYEIMHKDRRVAKISESGHCKTVKLLLIFCRSSMKCFVKG